MKLGTWATFALAIGAVLLVVGIALAYNNPTTDIAGDGAHQCFAPYDTILLGQRDNVGMPDHPREIENGCYSANRDRFILASVASGLGVVVGSVGAATLVRRRRQG